MLSHKPVIALITIFQVFPQLLFLKIFFHLKCMKGLGEWVFFCNPNVTPTESSNCENLFLLLGNSS